MKFTSREANFILAQKTDFVNSEYFQAESYIFQDKIKVNFRIRVASDENYLEQFSADTSRNIG